MSDPSTNSSMTILEVFKAMIMLGHNTQRGAIFPLWSETTELCSPGTFWFHDGDLFAAIKESGTASEHDVQVPTSGYSQYWRKISDQTIADAAKASAIEAAIQASAAAQSAIDAAGNTPEGIAQRVVNIENVTNLVTTIPTANAVPQADGDGKINKDWLSLDPPFNPQPSLSGTATFVAATNTITMTGIATALGLDVGDVIQFGGSADTNNKKLRTVESIIDNNTIVVNYEHCGNRGNGSLKLSAQSDVSVTCTRIAKWYNAPDSLGRAWIVLPASLRATDTTYTNSSGRPFFMTRMTTVNAGAPLYIDGELIAGATYTSGGTNTVSVIIPVGSTYRTLGLLNVWAELR